MEIIQFVLLTVGGVTGLLLFILNAISFQFLLGTFVILVFVAWFIERRGPLVSAADRGVLVTGCDTGLGFALVQELETKGLHVFAGCLFKDGEGAKKLKENCSERVHVLQLDVTKELQIKDALLYVKKNLPKNGLWAVVNNAGLNFLGETELTTMAQYKRVIDINLIGAIHITKTFLPLIIQTKGRIINVTSVKGLIAPVFCAAYASTKYALEGFSDCLRIEMKKWGVDVCIIEPCCFGSGTKAVDLTRMSKDFEAMWADMDDEMRDRYSKGYVDGFKNLITSSDRVSCFDISPVTRAMSDAILAVTPKIRYLIGGGNTWVDPYKYYYIWGLFLPYAVHDYILHEHFASKFPKPKALQS